MSGAGTIEDIMDKTIIINGAEIRVYVDGYSLMVSVTKDGVTKLDSSVSSIYLAKVFSPATLPAVRALIAEVKAGSKDEIAAAEKARKAELEAEEAEYQDRTGHYATYKHGRTPVASDAMARAMSVQG